MTIEQITENIYPEDRVMASIAADCHPKLVDLVLENKRGIEKGKGKKIYRFLRKAASINIQGYTKKEALANKLQTEI